MNLQPGPVLLIYSTGCFYLPRCVHTCYMTDAHFVSVGTLMNELAGIPGTEPHFRSHAPAPPDSE